MSQKEQYELVCKRCSHTSIFETEPPEDYECEICGPLPKEHEHGKFSKNYEILPKPSYWRCGNHHQTFKWNDSCPECSIKSTTRNFPAAGRIMLPNIDDEKTKNEIYMRKTEHEVRSKIREHQASLQQAQLDTPVLLKQLIEKMDKLVKVMENKNEVQS